MEYKTGWHRKSDNFLTDMFDNDTFGLSSVTGAGTVVNLYGQWKVKITL